MLASFVAIERRTEHPLIPLAYFRRRNFAFPIVTQFFLNFTYMGGFLLTGFLLQDVLGYSVSKTSVVSIARPIVFTITGPIAGYIAVKVGERSIAVAGALALVMSMVGMAMVGPGTSDAFIVVALGLSGFALGASGPSLAASIADEADLGIAGATQQMASQVGSTVGMQILVTIQIAREGVAGQAASYHTAYLVGAAVAALGVVTAAFVRSTRKAEALDAARGGGAPKGAPTSSSRELEPA
jgi:predicted MFS family arabinose efflux permease